MLCSTELRLNHFVGLLEYFMKSLVQVSTTRAFPYSAELSQEKVNNYDG